MTSRTGPSAASRTAVGFANAAHFYAHLFMLIFPTAVLVLGEDFGVAFGERLSLALPGFILFGIAALPAGWLGDKWSANGMMALFFLGTGAAAILTGLSAGPWGLAAGLALIGLFASIYHPVGTAVVVANAVNRGRALGLNGVCGSAGFATAPLITGAIIGVAGWRAAFIVPGALCVLTGLAFLVATRGAAGRAEAAPRPPDPGVRRRDAIRGLGILAVTSLAIGLISQSFMVGLPKMFDVGVSVLDWAGLMGTSGLVTVALAFGMVGQYLGGHLADRFPLKTVYVSMYAVMVPLAVVAAGLAELPLVAACAVMMLLSAGGLPAENSLVARYCPAAWHATAYGTKFVLALGVSSLAVPMVGAIYDGTGGFTWLLIAIAGFATVIVACAIFLPRLGASPAPVPAE